MQSLRAALQTAHKSEKTPGIRNLALYLGQLSVRGLIDALNKLSAGPPPPVMNPGTGQPPVNQGQPSSPPVQEWHFYAFNHASGSCQPLSAFGTYDEAKAQAMQMLNPEDYGPVQDGDCPPPDEP